MLRRFLTKQVRPVSSKPNTRLAIESLENREVMNDTPVAQPSLVMTNEDIAKTFATSDFQFTDTESDPLVSITVSALNLNTGDTLQLSGVDVAVNDVILEANIDDLVYTPAANANGAARSTFDFTANDAGGTGTVSATMTIDVTAVNDVPVALANTVTTSVANAFTFATGDFPFTDVELDALVSIKITNLSLNGNGTLKLSGVDVAVNDVITAANIPNLVYTPLGTTGTNVSTFSFAVNDADPGVVSAILSINVNALPVAQASSVTTLEDTSKTFAAADFLFNDLEPDALASITISALNLAMGDTLKLSGIDVAVNDTITAANIPNLVYAPAANQNGNARSTFDFKANDQFGLGTATAAMTINVTAVNDVPVAVASSVTATEDDLSLSFTVGDFDFTDVELDALASITVSNVSIAPGDTLEVDIGNGSETLTNGMTITAAQITSLTYVPAANAHGLARSKFDFTVNDADPGTVSATMSINVTPVNDGVPEAVASSVTTNEDVPKTFAVADFLFTDADSDPLASITISGLTLAMGDSLKLSGVDVADNDVITAANIPNLVYTPAVNLSGAARSTFDFTVNDALGNGTVSATMTINVTAVNDLPVALASSVTTNEDIAKTFAVADFNFTDVETDALVSITISALNLAMGDTLTLSGTPVGVNDVILAANIANLVYTPAANQNGLARSTFDFTVNDADFGTVSATMTIDVTAVNDAPVAVASSVTATEDDLSLSFTVGDFDFTDVELDALASITVSNVSIAPGDTLEVDLGGGPVTLANGMTITAAQITSLTYVPAANAHGLARSKFDFTVNDADLGTVAATMSINVTPVNDGVPEAQASSVTTNEDVPKTFAVADFVFTDDDNDALASITVSNLLLAVGDSLTVNQGAGPVPVTDGMVITAAQIPTLTYTPLLHANGLALSTFDFTVNDADPGTVSATMTINVTAVNDVPIAQPSSVTTNEDIAKTFALADFLFNDVETDPLASITISALNLGAGATLKLSGVDVAVNDVITSANIANLVYTPPANLNGLALSTFDFKVNDAGLGTVAATMTINVTAVNDAPVAQASSVTTNEDTAKTFAAADFLFTDVETDALVSITISGLTLATGDTLKLSGVDVAVNDVITVANIPNLVYTPAANANGNARSTFAFKANDAALGTVAATMTINVTADNDVPVALASSVTATEDTAKTFAVADFLFSDAESNALTSITVSGLTLASGDTLTVDQGAGAIPVTNNMTITAAQIATLTYTPAGNANGAARSTFAFTVNDAGGNGTVSATMTINVTAANDAPVLNTAPGVIVGIIPPKTAAASITGVSVAELTVNVSDIDAGAVRGIAITAAPSSAATGVWQFSTDAGVTWTGIQSDDVSVTEALLLANLPDNRIRFLPNDKFNGFASLSYKAWDTTAGTGTTGTTPSFGDSTVGTAFSTATEKASVAVGKTVPAINLNGNPLFTNILKGDANPAGDQVKSLLGLLSFDTNTKNVLGIAVTDLDNTNGKWQWYSAGKWIDIGNVSETNALLLSPTTKVRFLPGGALPAGSFEATLNYRAWDQTAGKVGEFANVAGSAFSTAEQTALVHVIAKPVLDTSFERTLTTLAPTALVGDLTDQAVSDVLVTDALGIAVTATTGKGTWTYTIGAAAPVAIKATLASAVLLPADAVLAFTPATGFTGQATLSYRAWNATTLPVAGGSKANAAGIAFSTATETLTTFVGVNATPAITTAAVSLGKITEDPKTNPGVAVSKIVTSAKVTDANKTDKQGIAITAADDTNGTWEYTLDGKVWKGVGAVSATAALALSGTAKLRFVPDANFFGTTPDIDFKAWDGTVGVSGDTVDTTVGTAYSTTTGVATVEVTSVNDSPVLDNTGIQFLPFIASTGVTSTSVTVATLLTGNVTDVETLAADIGIAVTAATGPGKWQYRPNGTGDFVDLKLPALLLPAADLQFVGAAGKTGVGTLTYQAWDKSSGAASAPNTVTAKAKTDALSVAKETLTIAVGNNAPSLTGGARVLTAITEDPKTNNGDTVAKLLGKTFADVGGVKKGIALTGTDNGGIGEWQYNLDGKTWKPVGAVSGSAALLLADTAKIRFVPAANQSGVVGSEPAISYVAWDQTVGVSGESIDVVAAGVNSFGAVEAETKITVTQVFDAPTLDTNLAQVIDSTATATGTALLAGASSPETTTFGIAVTGLTGKGTWEFSLDGFVTPGVAIPKASAAAAVLLASTASLRFVAATGFTGVATLSYKAWDSDNGSALASPANTTSALNKMFFSTAVETLSVNVGNTAPTLTTL